jgi:hypothetical protein
MKLFAKQLYFICLQPLAIWFLVEPDGVTKAIENNAFVEVTLSKTRERMLQFKKDTEYNVISLKQFAGESHYS